MNTDGGIEGVARVVLLLVVAIGDVSEPSRDEMVDFGFTTFPRTSDKGHVQGHMSGSDSLRQLQRLMDNLKLNVQAKLN